MYILLQCWQTMANAVKLQAYSLAKTFKATALVWIEPPSPQLEQKGFDVQQIQENYLLEPMTRDFIRNWLPEYSKILSKEIKLGKFEAQMHFIWVNYIIQVHQWTRSVTFHEK